MSEVSINKHNKSIVIARGDIAFSQFGIADEILDLIIEQGMEIDRLNNRITELEKGVSRKEEQITALDDENFDLENEIERLNNNINKGIEAINVYQNKKTLSAGYEDLKRIRGILRGNEFDLRMFEEYLQELKGVDKE